LGIRVTAATDGLVKGEMPDIFQGDATR